MGALFSEGAIISGGPLAQGVNRGIPSRSRGSSGTDPLREVLLSELMLQVYTKYFGLFSVLILMFVIVVLRGTCQPLSKVIIRLINVTLCIMI